MVPSQFLQHKCNKNTCEDRLTDIFVNSLVWLDQLPNRFRKCFFRDMVDLPSYRFCYTYFDEFGLDSPFSFIFYIKNILREILSMQYDTNIVEMSICCQDTTTLSNFVKK